MKKKILRPTIKRIRVSYY